jgi:ankyrin repeat protein
VQTHAQWMLPVAPSSTLHPAVDPVKLSLLQSTELDWTARDDAGNSCLHSATMFNHKSIVIRLWAMCGRDLVDHNGHQFSPLHIAAMNGQSESIRFFVQNGCKINDRD